MVKTTKNGMLAERGNVGGSGRVTCFLISHQTMSLNKHDTHCTFEGNHSVRTKRNLEP